MSGKWHVAGDFEARKIDSWRVGDIEHPTPRQRGFDHFYGIMDGATHFISPHYMSQEENSDWEASKMATYAAMADRTELTNLAGRHVGLETELVAQYQAWAEQIGVMDWEQALPRLLAAWKMETVDG